RPYDPERDFDAVVRTWREIGWIDTSDDQRASLGHFLEVGHSAVGVVDGDAECLVHWTPGTLRHTDTDLPLCGLTAVTTSRVARKLGLATALTARALVEGIDAGAAVAVLGMFEQGFYDRFGFGTGPYEHRVRFDPRSLDVDMLYRPPVRVTPDDWEDVHAALLRRHRDHGSLTLDPPGIARAELGWIENPFGLGYRDESGELTHFVMGPAKGEHGPYRIWHLAYRDTAQLLELLRMLRELGDQVASIDMMEPPEIQLQDLVRQPIRRRIMSAKSEHELTTTSLAFWQLRILDLEACVAAHRWRGPEVVFDLTLDDPLGGLVDGAGIAGDYTVTVADPATVEPGHRGDVPRLRASVNAFSRLWFGVRSASALAVTDDVAAPADLLAALDESLRLPPPRLGWFI
ncbi:MAG: GNAT family N-acetyltransferase, partial [Acidimicrobiia bacterium]|nr:GNAT family N-acetyltransferase [Acidimicrobiia bacterium]